METFTEEGLKAILNLIPRNAGELLPDLLYLGVFTTNTTPQLTPTTVPDKATVLSDPGTAIGEPTIGVGGYSRIAIPKSDWGAPVAIGSSGYRSTAAIQSFPQSSAAWDNPTIVGFFLASSPDAGSGIVYFYSNFDDNTSVLVNAGNIVLQVAPFWQINY